MSTRITVGLSAAVAVLAAIASALGVFARGDGTYVTVTSARGEVYDMATTGVYAYNAKQLVAEGVGWDVFTLFVAVPALVVAAILASRGSFGGLVATGGMLGYFAYMHLEYAVTWAFGPLLPVFIAILAASATGIVGVGVTLAAGGVRGRFDERYPRRAWATLSSTMAAMLTVLWAARIAEALVAGTPALHGETTMTVQALDLGLVVPVSVLMAVAVLHRHPAGLVAGAAFMVTFVVMCAAIAAMMISSWLVTGVLALPPIVVFGAASGIGSVLVVRAFRSIAPAEARPGPSGAAVSLALPAH